jgi:hypothetical protein
MSYDLVVFPADRVTTLHDAVLLHGAVLGGEHGGDPPPSLGDLVSEVGTWTDVRVTADARGAVLHLPVDPADPADDGRRLLTAVLRAAADRQLAVADVRAPMLYDPRERVDVTVKLGDDTVLPYLSRSLLAFLLPLPGPYPWLIVERQPEVYVQTRRLPDLSYDVEHRAGGAGQHFQAHTPDPTVVHRAIWYWTTGDPRWHDTVPWEHLDL